MAYQVAQRYPSAIKKDVVKMVEYYENCIYSQVKDYHKLVEENGRLKRENMRLQTDNYGHEIKEEFRKEAVEKEKENRSRTPLRGLSPINLAKTPERSTNNSEVEEYKKKLVLKDAKIN